MTGGCPICGETEQWDSLDESCQACGHYNESKAHGWERRERERAERRIEDRRFRR